MMRTHHELETIVTFFCDEGEKYISEHFAGGTNDGEDRREDDSTK